jgi:hypothetical protein
MARGPTVVNSGVENVLILVQDTSGVEITTLDHTSGITIEYRDELENLWTEITPKVAGTVGIRTSKGFVHDGYGRYQLGLPAAAKTGSGNFVAVRWRGTGIKTDEMLVPIHRLDHQTAIVTANILQLLGTAWLPPDTPGTPDVNAKLIGGTAQSTGDLSALIAAFRGTVGTLDNLFQRTGTARAGGGPNQIKLAATEDSTTLGPCRVRILSGTGAGEVRYSITGVVSAAGLMSTTPAWSPSEPDATSVYLIESLQGEALASVCTEARLAELVPVYHADIEITRDGTNTRDEYTATWFKNGVRITTGITVPTIQLIKRADGTDLVASTAMTQVGSTGSYKYDEATNRLTAGEAAVCIVAATIDGTGRTFARVVSRDAT